MQIFLSFFLLIFNILSVFLPPPPPAAQFVDFFLIFVLFFPKVFLHKLLIFKSKHSLNAKKLFLPVLITLPINCSIPFAETLVFTWVFALCLPTSLNFLTYKFKVRFPRVYLQVYSFHLHFSNICRLNMPPNGLPTSLKFLPTFVEYM